MTPERFERVERVFRAALERPPAERQHFLDRSCRHDSDLRREVDSLLASHEEAGSFLDTPVAANLTSPVRTFLPDQLVADRFRIVRFLAEGGMGEVYAAEDSVTSELVAVKTIRPSFLDDEEAERRFLRESQLARRVTHVNVCRTYDVFEHKVTLGRQEASIRFLTMELLNGETLADRLRRTGAMSVERALTIGRQIASGLAAAHDAGVVHRDLKPENVILVSAKGDPAPSSRTSASRVRTALSRCPAPRAAGSFCGSCTACRRRLRASEEARSLGWRAGRAGR